MERAAVDAPADVGNRARVAEPLRRRRRGLVAVESAGGEFLAPLVEMRRDLVLDVLRDTPGPVLFHGRDPRARVTAEENRSQRFASALSCARPSSVMV
jgi:trimethylamine:corrinoid methyltransferase-like protein